MWKKEKKAFKEGKRIQIKYNTGSWHDTGTPEFREYRIHPEDIEPITEWHDKLVVHCKTLKQMEKVIDLQPKGKSAIYFWEVFYNNTCVENDGLCCSKEFYKKEGFEVIKAKEFLKRYKLKKKEIGKEPLKEGEWAAFWDSDYNGYKVDMYAEYWGGDYCHKVSDVKYQFALPISVGHEAILKAMEETKDA